MSSISSDFLRKEEVLFEITIRGEEVSPSLDKTALDNILRNLLSSNIQPGPLDKESISVSDEIALYEKVQHEFIGMARDPDLSIKQVRRTLARLLHWRNRMERVLVAFPHEQKLKSLCSSFEDLRVDLEKSRVTINSKLRQIVGIQDVQDKTKNVPGNFTVGVDSFASSSEQVDSHNSSVKENSGHNHNNHFVNNRSGFQFEPLQVPNPLRDCFSSGVKLNVRSPVDVFTTLKTIVHVSKLAAVLKMDEYAVVQLLYTYSEGMLADYFLSLLSNFSTLDNVHQSIIHRFLPQRVYNQLLTLFYYRPQRPAEPFLQYVKEIAVAASALRAPFNEVQIVANIAAGALRSEVRASLLSTSPPTTISRLEEMSVLLSDFECAKSSDQLGDESRNLGNVAGNTNVPSNVANTSVRANDNSNRNVPSCTYCHKRGHIISRCFKKQRDDARVPNPSNI